MSSMKLPPEPTGDYVLWKKDVELWQKLTDTPKAKMGIALQYVCRNNSKLHEAIVNIDSEKVDKEGGIEEVIKVLDKLHNIDQKESTLNSYEVFENLKRKENQTVPEFILEFENLTSKMKKNGITLTEDLLAFQLLKKTNLSDYDERMIRASTTEFKLENIKSTLKRCFGENSVKSNRPNEWKIKEEPIFQVAGIEGHSKEDSEEETIFYTNK